MMNDGHDSRGPPMGGQASIYDGSISSADAEEKQNEQAPMSLMHISLKQLRAFTATVDCGSFTRAAERLHLTQSAVSMVIRQLETEIGLPLFNRENKRLTLTDMG